MLNKDNIGLFQTMYERQTSQNTDEGEQNPHQLFKQVLLFLKPEISVLYSRAVGEMGIAPADFWQMTEEQINVAYEGYMRRQELTANLTKLAFVEALNKNTTPISIVKDKGYTIGSIQERTETFRQLGVL